MEKKQPIILVSAGRADTKSITSVMAAIAATGAKPMLIANHSERLSGASDEAAIEAAVAADMAKADGIMVMGSDLAIDPRDYKATSIHEKTAPIMETSTPEGIARRTYEYILLKKTLESKKPLLTVCAGTQRLNVLLGGDLHQYVPDLLGGNEYHNQGKDDVPGYLPVQFVKMEQGSHLASLTSKEGLYTPTHAPLPEGVSMENSFHFQAVNNLGKGLRVAARSIEPGTNVQITEAIEGDPAVYKDQYIVGVQWHPEFGASELSANLLRDFVGKSAEYAKGHSADIAMDETAKSARVATTWQDRIRSRREQLVGGPSGPG